jgi:hypothetical protein
MKMGWLSNISKAISAPVAAISRAVAAPVAAISRAVAAPVAAISRAVAAPVSFVSKPVAAVLNFATVATNSPIATVKAITQGGNSYNNLVTESFNRPVQEQVLNTVVNTGIAAGAVLTAGTSVGRTAVIALLPKTPLGVVAAVPAALVGGSFIFNEPETAKDLAIDTTTGLINVGKNLGELVKEPTLENFKELVTDNPVLIGGAALAIGGAAAIAGAGIVSNILNREAVKENTEAILNSNNNNLPLTQTKKVDALAPILPITPQTQTLTKTTTTKRKKKKINPPMNISQKVNVMVNNKNSSVGIRVPQKYLNRQALYN